MEEKLEERGRLGFGATIMGRNYQTLSPATGKIHKEFPVISNEEARHALNTAHSCYTQDWQFRPVSERARIVAGAAKLMRAQIDSLANLATLEMGKLIDSSKAELELSASILEYYAEHAADFLKPTTIPEHPGAVVHTQPIGVILAIEPWNFPYYQLARVAGPQIMAGNVVIVKDARNVPQCTEAFARLFKEAGAPEGVYTNLLCSFDAVNALIDDFRVRGITLTGSETSGAEVAERAGRNLKKVVLELGGSDPFIVLEDADLEKAVADGVDGRLSVMGQECTASKRFIIVGKERGRLFQQGMKKAFDALKFGDPADSATTLGPLSSEKAVTGLLKQIETAKEHGAKVVAGGKRIDHPGFYMEPTIVTDITPSNPLFQEETFGPVASLYIVSSEEEAIEIANATKFGLGASVYCKNEAHAQEVALKIDSGMVYINSPAHSNFAPELPFGGVKNSGFGRELGELGFGEFVNRKLVTSAQ
ncbi:Succinate-semialdehyde dehydrogenase [NADP(+)] [Lachnellula occidentalis]|uniref:Succinate-semialdehyde dehydrogenase [NADP(+)] n=1 Tax=Lachnellula occidentalis TaxID=215460 RepID=A0A8H8RZV1_9HELO|nr:Succinate-semialdehyde dehydrogenase [NADP(+)] [Lachnellula occidentalis]